MSKLPSWNAVARFTFEGNITFRTNTLLFNTPLLDINKSAHICSVVMLNPGSAKPKSHLTGETVDCSLDPTMERIISWLQQAFQRADRSFPAEAHVSIFNLYNNVASNPKQAIPDIIRLGSQLSKEEINPLKFGRPRFVWQAWGLFEEDIIQGRIEEVKETLGTFGLLILGDHPPLLKNYHPSYLNRNNKGRRDHMIDVLAESIRSFVSK